MILFVLLLTSCSRDEAGDEPTPQPQQVTRWECILFGSYPANEVVSSSFNAVDDYALVEGDVIVDATLYSQLEHAEWTDDDTEGTYRNDTKNVIEHAKYVYENSKNDNAGYKMCFPIIICQKVVK